MTDAILPLLGFFIRTLNEAKKNGDDVESELSILKQCLEGDGKLSQEQIDRLVKLGPKASAQNIVAAIEQHTEGTSVSVAIGGDGGNSWSLFGGGRGGDGGDANADAKGTKKQ